MVTMSAGRRTDRSVASIAGVRESARAFLKDLGPIVQDATRHPPPVGEQDRERPPAAVATRRKRRAALLAVAGEGDRSGNVLTSRRPSCQHQGLRRDGISARAAGPTSKPRMPNGLTSLPL
jgi:hypothetical protein